MDSKNTRLNITFHRFHRQVTREETNDTQNKSERENVGDLNNAQNSTVLTSSTSVTNL